MPSIARQKPTKKEKKVSRKSEGPLDRIVDLEDIPDEGINLCVYGKSGTGKTRFISTFAKLGPLLHVICSSNGLNEARSIKGVKNIKIVDVQAPEDLTYFIEYAQENKFVTVALDHVTGFCDCVLADIMGIDRIPEQSSWGMARREDYQQMGLQVKTYLRSLFDLECNIVIAGQERTFDSTEDSGELIMPYISVGATPSVAGWIAPAVDYLCHTFKREKVIDVERNVGGKSVTKTKRTGKVEYCLRVGPDETYMTKFRVPPGTDLPDVVVDPTYEKIAYLINGEE